jgi:hypothetical protein
MTTPNDPRHAPLCGDPLVEEDEVPGDTHAADIVSRTGEEMPVQRHAEVHRPAPPRPKDDPRS